MNLSLYQLYQKMEQEIGPTNWWPADSKAEIICGAITIQNTNWRNADKAVANLRAATRFKPAAIRAMQLDELEKLVRPAGFFHNKAKSLQAIFSWLKQWDNDYDQIRDYFNDQLRPSLLKLRGIGPETADVLRLFVFDQACFVADKYARTLFEKMGAGHFENYASLYRACHLSDQFTLHDAQELHALIDEFGKQYLHRPDQFSTSFLVGDRLLLS